MQATYKKSVFYPDFIATSVLELKSQELKKRKITHLVFDIDETVVPKAHNALSDEYIDFLQLLEKHGFVILIGSNSKRDLTEITRHLNSVVVPPTRYSFKPLKSYFKRVIKEAGTEPARIAMVGDRIVNDVIGANNAGLTSILVEPYARRQSLPHKQYIKAALR